MVNNGEGEESFVHKILCNKTGMWLEKFKHVCINQLEVLKH